MLRQQIFGALIFIVAMGVSFFAVVDNDSSKRMIGGNYQLPFIVPVETLESLTEISSICGVLSFSQNGYQQCLFSVEGVRPSMLKKVTIAIIDSGIDLDHYYFKGIISKKSKSFIDNTLASEIDHGTHVAGILVKNLLSLSFEERIDIPFELLILKVIEKSKSKDEEKRAKYPYVAKADLVGKAVKYAISQGASIINISIFGEDPSEDQERLFKESQHSGVPIVVAAGNGTTDLDVHPGFPCTYKLSNLYCVGNVSSNGELAVSSNFGKVVKFYSLGTNINSTVANYSWGKLTGTSMAAPKLAAVMLYSRVKNIPITAFYGKHYITNPLDRSSLYIRVFANGMGEDESFVNAGKK